MSAHVEEQQSVDHKDDQSETSDFVEVTEEDTLESPFLEAAEITVGEPIDGNLQKGETAKEETQDNTREQAEYTAGHTLRDPFQTAISAISPLSGTEESAQIIPSRNARNPHSVEDSPISREYYGQLLDTYGDEEAAAGKTVPVFEHPLQNVEPYESYELPEDEIEYEDPYEANRPPAPELDAQPIDPNEKGHVKGFKNAKETTEMVGLPVIGELPKWLKGELFTIGPGTYDINYGRKIMIDDELQMATVTFRFEHWFDALPLVNRFDFDGPMNQVLYRSRLPFRRLISKIRDHHGYQPTHPAGLFQTNTNQSFLAKFLKPVGKASKPDLEPCSACVRTQIPGIEGRLFAQNNATEVVELDPFDLTATSHFSWNELNPAFRGHQASPHPQYDPNTGEWINFTMEVNTQGASYHFFSLTEINGKGNMIASVQAKASFVHSFALTPRYIILAVFPFHANYAGMQFAWYESILDSFSFRNEPTLFYVISRQRKQHIATYRADACFAFHHINAFEDIDDSIHLDIACYNDATIAYQLAINSLRHPEGMIPSHLATAEVRRYSLNRITEEAANFENNGGNKPSSWIGGFVKMIKPSATDGYNPSTPIATHEKIVDATIELPQVNPVWRLNRNRYLFGIGMSTEGILESGRVWDAIVKADLEKHKITSSWFQEGCFPSEALFIPAPAQKNPNTQLPNHIGEDDGVLVSIVLDSIRNKSFLLVLDAKTFSEVAKVDLPHVVPLSFAHGNFRPSP